MIPFPSSARDIYYVTFAGGLQILEEYVRFSVDPKDLDSAVSNILSDYDTAYHWHNSNPSLPITNAPVWHISKNLMPIPWWSPNSITNGYYRGNMTGWSIGVWVDVGQHLIYVSKSD